MKTKTSSDTKRSDSIEETRMSLIEHLSEVRNRLIVVVICFIATTAACLSRVEWIVQQFLSRATDFEFVYISPSELVVSYIKLGLTGGLILTSPVIIYEIWAFAQPGLKSNEKRVGFLSLFFGMILFVVGAAFAFFVAIPLMLSFFAGVDTTGTIRPMISFENYMGFLTSTMLTFGIVFEMPIVTVVLTQLGIVSHELLTKSRKLVIVVIFTVAAIITPPDVLSQVMVAIPMLILFEISIFISKLLKRKKYEDDEDE